MRGGKDVVLEVRSSVHGPIVTDVLDGRRRRSGSPSRCAGPGSTRGTRRPRLSSGIDRAVQLGGVPRRRRAARGAGPEPHLRRRGRPHRLHDDRARFRSVRASDGLLPVSGAGEDDWSGFIPFEQLPRVLDPAARVRRDREQPRRLGALSLADRARLAGALPGATGSRSGSWRPGSSVAGRAFARSSSTAISEQADDLLPLLLDTAPADAPSADALGASPPGTATSTPDSVPASIYAAWYTALSAMPEDERRACRPGACARGS